MISDVAYVAYFENLATQSLDFNHVAGTNNAFFYLPEPWDLTEIDNAVKSSKSVPFMTLDSIAGQMDDSGAENHVETINGQIMILDTMTVGNAQTIRETRDKCLQIGLRLLARMKRDSRNKTLIDPLSRFTISKVSFDPIGPIMQKHYGYSFRFKITCPFGFSVTSEIWRDIE